MFSLTVLLLAVPYHSGADAASLPSGGNGAEQPLRGLLFVAKQAVKKTAEALIFRFVGMGRGALGLLNRFGGSLSGEHGGGCLKDVGKQLGHKEHALMQQLRRAADPDAGYDPMLKARMRAVLPACGPTADAPQGDLHQKTEQATHAGKGRGARRPEGPPCTTHPDHFLTIHQGSGR